MKTLLVSMVLALAAAGPGAVKTDSGMVCTITGQHVEQCCCVEKDGAMICTLTGEVVSSCCCTEAAK